MEAIKDALDATSDAFSSSALLTIATIILIAWIAHNVIRFFIKRTVRGLQGDKLQKGLGIVRNRTPRAFQNTGQYTSVRRVQRAETIGAILRSFSTVVIVVLAAFFCVSQLDLGAALAPFIATTAVATAALGFGAQYIVRDFLSGFFIVVEDQYGVGDVILVDDDVSGTVESVSLRTTRLRAEDGTLWHVPNGEIKRIGNRSQTRVSRSSTVAAKSSASTDDFDGEGE